MPADESSLPESFRDAFHATLQELRSLSLPQLRASGGLKKEIDLADGRKGKIESAVSAQGPDAVRVIVRGFLPSRWFAQLENECIDGFTKRADGSTVQLDDRELDLYD
jgi:hypothetical protein